MSVDFLAFTVARPIREVLDFLATVINGYVVQPRDRGVNGFEQSAELVGLGLVGWGGAAVGGRVWVSLSGAGCAAINDFHRVASQLQRWGAKLTRVDVAYDDRTGESVSVDMARSWYAAGLFDLTNRRPVAALYDDLGSGAGRTFYVGRRGSGKLARVYEKGRALGDRFSTWVRAEVELRAADRVIPYDILTRPASYLAGAYPAFAFVSQVRERVRICKVVAARTLAQVVKAARVQAGRVFGFLNSCGVDPASIVDAFSRPGTPRRLMGWDRHVRGDLGEVLACLQLCKS